MLPTACRLQQCLEGLKGAVALYMLSLVLFAVASQGHKQSMYWISSPSWIPCQFALVPIDVAQSTLFKDHYDFSPLALHQFSSFRALD